MKYYHNPRCAKSREGLALLKEKGLAPQIVEYLKEPLTPQELSSLVGKLGLSAKELIRTSEKIWKEEFKGKELSEEELVLAMIEHPKLMQRPILEKEDKAALGRPPKNLLQIV
jgi:arsenate reductase